MSVNDAMAWSAAAWCAQGSVSQQDGPPLQRTLLAPFSGLAESKPCLCGRCQELSSGSIRPSPIAERPRRRQPVNTSINDLCSCRVEMNCASPSKQLAQARGINLSLTWCRSNWETDGCSGVPEIHRTFILHRQFYILHACSLYGTHIVYIHTC